MQNQRLVVGISGSSGAILGIRLLEILQSSPIETHLIVTPSARLTIEQETRWKVKDVLALASVHYPPQDIGAAIASGSFATMGMVVIPCSIKSLSAIANSYSNDLLVRAADVTLKEGRPLVLVLREAPLHSGHIRLMEQASAAGAVIFPPVPAFYTLPQTVDEIVDNIAGRVLRRLGIDNDHYLQWQGIGGRTIQHPVPLEKQGREDSQAKENRETSLWNLPAMTLATSTSDGKPFAAAVYFAGSPEHEIFFFSSPNSQHSANLRANPQAAATIHPLVEGWQEICGLQLRGQVQEVPAGEEWERGWGFYLEKFPFAAELKDLITQNTLYIFRPDWIRLIDNQQGFGYKEEWTRD